MHFAQGKPQMYTKQIFTGASRYASQFMLGEERQAAAVANRVRMPSEKLHSQVFRVIIIVCTPDACTWFNVWCAYLCVKMCGRARLKH